MDCDIFGKGLNGSPTNSPTLINTTYSWIENGEVKWRACNKNLLTLSHHGWHIKSRSNRVERDSLKE